MSASIIAGLLLAQTATITVEAPRGPSEVGYRELAEGRPSDAIGRIDGDRFRDASDPAALINRGTALARLGDKSAAHASYLAALASRENYDLELSDGSWLASRAAARLAIRMLETGTVLALK